MELENLFRKSLQSRFSSIKAHLVFFSYFLMSFEAKACVHWQCVCVYVCVCAGLKLVCLQILPVSRVLLCVC